MTAFTSFYIPHQYKKKYLHLGCQVPANLFLPLIFKTQLGLSKTFPNKKKNPTELKKNNFLVNIIFCKFFVKKRWTELNLIYLCGRNCLPGSGEHLIWKTLAEAATWWDDVICLLFFLVFYFLDTWTFRFWCWTDAIFYVWWICLQVSWDVFPFWTC